MKTPGSFPQRSGYGRRIVREHQDEHASQ